jgi:hypothetical protein
VSILIPDRYVPNTATPELITAGGILSPTGGGGSDQRLNRLGDRYQIAIKLPARLSGSILSGLLAALKQALTQGAVMKFHQPGLRIGTPGTPVVDGGNQGGSFIALRGLQPGYAIRIDQFFSIVHNGRRYLHSAAAQTIAGADGKAIVPITPMLRIRPADGAVCEFAPHIEGFLTGNSVAWTHTRARTDPPAFTIKEAE